MFFTSDNLDSIPLTTPIGPLLKTIFYGTVYGIVDSFSQDENEIAPQILIECRPEQRNDVARVFLEAVRTFVEVENKKIEEKESDEEEGEEEYYYFVPDMKALPCDKGVAVYISECEGSVGEESEMDPMADPLFAAIKKLEKKFPDVLITVALMYHIDVGYNYGYNTLWLEGDERKSTALLLNFAMRQDDFWNEKDWRSCSFQGGYEGLLSITLNLMDLLDGDILDVFASHIPEEDAERKAALLERIREYKAQAPVAASPSPEKKASTESCKGLTFVITGKVNIFENRDAFTAYVERQGGKVTGSVSKKTDYLVNNDLNSNSTKNQKARELGIPVISEEAFVEKFGRNDQSPECAFCGKECNEKVIRKRSPDGSIYTVCKQCCVDYDLSDWETVEDD